ncbi:MAG: VWA domain-containing protein [Thiothrix sp.]|nr:VWA domain-containing protein [Thiothrix sp.]HPE61992.1 vWA domain-containing protein [Thiolinea sp.]
MENLSFSHPDWFWLLPLCLLPLWRWQRRNLDYPAIGLLPPDLPSRLLDLGIRVLLMLLLATLITAMAEPFRGEQRVEKTGTGAHVVILLDRSSSMNDSFTRGAASRYRGSKNAVAREVLNRLVDEGGNDFYGLVSFSTSALYRLPLTQEREVIRAGINSTLNRGRGSTAIERGITLALSYFDAQHYSGSRVILLVSDGGGMITLQNQARLRQQFDSLQVAVYWIYLKSTHGNRLVHEGPAPERSGNPEYFLNRFFQSLAVPYHAYEVEEPGALDAAIADIGQLNNQPLRYEAIIPRRDLAGWCYGLALVLGLLLLPVRWLEAEPW